MKTLEQYGLDQGIHYSKMEDWMKNLSEYERQAIDFLLNTETEFKAVMTGHGKYFDDDKETRDIYEITLTRKDKKPFIFRFGQSIVNSGTISKPYKLTRKAELEGKMILRDRDFESKRKSPSAYDVLASIQKYEIGTFENFCDDFGYDIDSRAAEKTYFAVQKEYAEVCRLWNEKEREALQEIQ